MPLSPCSTLALSPGDRCNSAGKASSLGGQPVPVMECELSGLAKRIPKAKKGNTVAESNANQTLRSNLMWLVDFVVKNEMAATTIRDMLQNGQILWGSEAKSQAQFSELPKNLQKVDKDFKVKWNVDHSEGSIDYGTLAYQDSVDEHFVHDCFLMFVFMSGHETLPDPCIDKKTLALGLELRMQRLGGETPCEWARRIQLSNGVPTNKHLSGPFLLCWEHGRLASIIHRRSGVRAYVEQDINVDPSFVFQNYASERVATLFKSKLRQFRCLDFFDKEQFPLLAADPSLDKKGEDLKALIAEAAVAVQAKRASGAVQEDRAPLLDHTAARKQKALAMAREAQAAKPKRARTLNFEGLDVGQPLLALTGPVPSQNAPTDESPHFLMSERGEAAIGAGGGDGSADAVAADDAEDHGPFSREGDAGEHSAAEEKAGS